MHVRLQENVYTSRRERERFHFIRARTPLALEGLKLLQFFEHVPDFRSLLGTGHYLSPGGGRRILG